MFKERRGWYIVLVGEYCMEVEWVGWEEYKKRKKFLVVVLYKREKVVSLRSLSGRTCKKVSRGEQKPV
jgi:hypothetical protein